MLAGRPQRPRQPQQHRPRPPAEPVGRHHEPDRGLGDPQVLQRGGVPLAVVGLQQLLADHPGADQRDLPREVVGVLDAAVHAARTVGRQRVRGVAREQHPPHPQPVDDPLVEPVGADPVDLVRDVADHRADPLVEPAVGALGLDVGVGRQLPVDPPDVVGLRVHHELPAGVEHRVVVEVPLLGQRQLGLDVGDQEPVLVGVPGPLHADQVAQSTPDTVAGDQVREDQVLLPQFGDDPGGDRVRVLRQAGDPVPPAQVAKRLGLDRLGEHLLDAVLGDVDERPEPLAARVLRGPDLLVAHVGPGDRPRHALLGDGPRAPDLVQHLQDVALDQARLRALLHQVGVGLQQHARHAEPGQPQRGDQTHGSGADDPHRRVQSGGHGAPVVSLSTFTSASTAWKTGMSRTARR